MRHLLSDSMYARLFSFMGLFSLWTGRDALAFLCVFVALVYAVLTITSRPSS